MAATGSTRRGATRRTRPGAVPRRRIGLALLLLGLVALLTVLMTVRVPYAIMSPGPAVNTLGKDDSGKPLVSVSGHPTYPTTGALDFTTVSLRGGPAYPVTALDVIGALLTPHHEVLPADQVFPPNASADEVKAESTAQMQSSQESATVVALRALGLSVPERVLVASVPEGSPAFGKLHADDIVTKVDGAPVATSAAAREAIRKRRSGDLVTVSVERKNGPVDVPVTATSREGTTVLGILLRPTFTFPVKVSVSAGDVGGPSAGTMFALAIYDSMTPGALTGGRRIAGTGALDPDGTVEPIGGIAEKMVAAHDAGAEWFLAPRANCTEVVGNIPDGLQVVSVATFDDAVKAVGGIGKGSTKDLPRCS